VVVSCEQAVAAPLATRHLADLGARVIKIERPGTGDFARQYDETVHGLSSHFVWLNRSKESVALDLKSPESKILMQQLIDRADVFVQNFAPGAAARLGLGGEELRASRPGLITCSISGYGPTGPYASAKAYDLLIQSEAGLLSVTGTEGEPAKAGIPVADIAAGMYSFSSILASLFAKERTGEGSQIEISMFDSLVEWMAYPLLYTKYGKIPPARTGTSHAAIAPYGIIESGDGTEFVVAVQNEREWRRFCEAVLSRPTLRTDPRFLSVSQRSDNRVELNHELVAALAAVDGAELQRRLSAGGIAHARRRSVPEVLEHPQLAPQNRWATIGSPVGPVEVLRPPGLAKDWEEQMTEIPELGQHTESVCEWLGVSPPLYVAVEAAELAPSGISG